MPSGKLLQEPYEAILSELNLHFLLVDSAGRILYANPRAESALVARKGSLGSLMLDSLFSLRNPQWLSHEVRKCASEKNWDGEVVLNRHDGTELWAHVQACKCPEALGVRDCILLEFEDITGNIELMTTLMKRNEDLFQRNRELEIVNRVGRLLLADTDLEYRLAAMLKEAARTVGVSCGLVWMRSRDGQEFIVRGSYGFGPSLFVNTIKVGIDEHSLAGRTLQARKPLAIEDMLSQPSKFSSLIRQLGVRSVLSVPMIANDDVVGVLVLGETGVQRSFAAEEITLVEVIANSVASAITNALLAEDIEVSRAYWQRTFDAIGDIIMVVDGSCKVLRANKALASRLDVNTPDLIGESCETLIYGASKKLIQKTISSGEPVELGERIVAGEQCAVTAFPLARDNGKTEAAVVYARVMAAVACKTGRKAA